MLKTLNSSYLDPAERAFVRSGGFDSVVLWAPPWAQLQPTFGEIVQSAWTQLDTGVANAHADGLKTFIAIGSDSPKWANAQRSKRVNAQNGKCAPDNLSATGPWAYYIALVLTRHPHVQGVIVMNEPQFAFGEDAAHYVDCVVEQIKSAAQIWGTLKAEPLLLAPALFDWNQGGWDDIDYFTDAVLKRLHSWHPPSGVRMGLSQHCYTGITNHSFSTVKNTLDLLDVHQRDWVLYLTECGLQFNTERDPAFTDGYHWRETNRAIQEQKQLDGLRYVYGRCKQSGRVGMLAQYLYADHALSGSGWMSGFVRPDGTLRPIHDEWRKL